MSGAMWTLSPERVNAELLKEASLRWEEGTLRVMLLADVPQGMRALMAPAAARAVP